VNHAKNAKRRAVGTLGHFPEQALAAVRGIEVRARGVTGDLQRELAIRMRRRIVRSEVNASRRSAAVEREQRDRDRPD
jgi:hypothetical protein